MTLFICRDCGLHTENRYEMDSHTCTRTLVAEPSAPGFSTHDLFFSNGYKAAMEEMAKRRCGTCKHWRNVDKYDMNVCHKGVEVSLCMVPVDFGCVLWEKRDA